MTRSSVLRTQKDLYKLEEEQRRLNARLKLVKAKIETAMQKHREMIKRNLNHPDPEEQRMARGVARYWEVPLDE